MRCSTSSSRAGSLAIGLAPSLLLQAHRELLICVDLRDTIHLGLVLLPRKLPVGCPFEEVQIGEW